MNTLFKNSRKGCWLKSLSLVAALLPPSSQASIQQPSKSPPIDRIAEIRLRLLDCSGQMAQPSKQGEAVKEETVLSWSNWSNY